MNAVLIGYFVKKPKYAIADRNMPPVVKEICSVTTCDFEEPPDWLEQWKHNDYFFYDSPEEALLRIANLSNKEDYDLYAYKLYPVSVDNGKLVNKEVIAEKAKPLPDDFKFLGYDAVNKTQDYGQFECSALSCNGGYDTFPVNQYCLFSTFEEALSGAKIFSAEGWEPGPYYIMEVYRRRKQ